MYPDRTHIYKFIKIEFGLGKKDLAAKLFFDSSNLAPSRPYDTARIYDAVFKKESKDAEEKIQNSLKYFLREFEGLLADIWNKNYEDFVTGLLQRANVTPPKDIPVGGISTPLIQSEISADQVRDLFLKITEHYGIMEIINRKPAVFYRKDSDNLYVYIGEVDGLILNSPSIKNNMLLYVSMENFVEELRIQAFTIMANLNNHFDFEDESAFVDMEEDGASIEPNEPETMNGVLKSTPELVSTAANPLRLMETIFKEWGNFRNELNLLYEKIKSKAV